MAELARAKAEDYDVSAALSLGARARQEDALVTSFAQGSDIGFAVLSDGMGGHAAGDLASRIIVSEVFAELTLRTASAQLSAQDIPNLLRYAVDVANDCLRGHIDAHPKSRGMGGTVIAPLVSGSKLHWISVGDSVLYLFRDGELSRLNEDHSMAPQIDMMVEQGLMDEETARDHPQRNCLTSAIIGEQIAVIDCPDIPFDLKDGDLVLAASDGLQFLSDEEIAGILRGVAGSGSRQIADALLTGVASISDPDQDNTSVVVIKAEAKTGPGEEMAEPASASPAAIFRACARAFSPTRPTRKRAG